MTRFNKVNVKTEYKLNSRYFDYTDNKHFSLDIYVYVERNLYICMTTELCVHYSVYLSFVWTPNML